jgi:uncharacterized alkaline shock family protein YloU
MPDRESEQSSDPLTQTSQRTPRPAPSTVAPMLAVETVSTQGKTAIADSVVAKIVGLAAREIEGVHDLATSGAGAAIGGFATRMTGGDQRAQGVSVEVGAREAIVDLNMVVIYGVSIPQVAEAVRRNIISRVAAMTGLVVKEVNIAVSDLYFPQDQALQQQQPRVQ